MFFISCDVILITIVQLIITQYFQFCANFVQLSFLAQCAEKLTFCALKMLANGTSVIIQFRLTQFLCYISPEARAAVEVKKSYVKSHVWNRTDTEKTPAN